MLDMAGTLSARALKGLRASRSRIARSVATVIGISLFLPISVAESGSIDAIDPKTYIQLHYPQREALCLIKLYGKESAFDRSAVGNEDGTHKAYGIPQLKNPIIKDLSANKQIDYGMKYVAHRYGTPCKAYAHSINKGWY
jgi:hypothetical protein